MNAQATQVGCHPWGPYGEGDTIVVPSGHFPFSQSLEIRASFEIRGEGATRSYLQASAYRTTPAFVVTSPTVHLKLTSVTLRGAWGNARPGIFVSTGIEAFEELVNVHLVDSVVSFFNDSGIIVSSGGSVLAESSAILRNTTPSDGGGVRLLGSHGTFTRFEAIEGTTIGRNTARKGGGIYNYMGNMQMQGTHLYGNSATSSGGAFWCEYVQNDGEGPYCSFVHASDQLVNFTGNSAPTAGVGGGSMTVEFPSPLATASDNSLPLCSSDIEHCPVQN